MVQTYHVGVYYSNVYTLCTFIQLKIKYRGALLNKVMYIYILKIPYVNTYSSAISHISKPSLRGSTVGEVLRIEIVVVWSLGCS